MKRATADRHFSEASTSRTQGMQGRPARRLTAFAVALLVIWPLTRMLTEAGAIEEGFLSISRVIAVFSATMAIWAVDAIGHRNEPVDRGDRTDMGGQL